MKKEIAFLALGVILLSFSAGLVFLILLEWIPPASSADTYTSVSYVMQAFYLMFSSFVCGTIGGFLIGLYSHLFKSNRIVGAK